MNYNQYLFSNLLKLHDSEFEQMEYDLQFEAINKLYNEFVGSEFNSEKHAEYDCMVDFLENKYRNRYVFCSLHIQNGEYEYFTNSVHILPNDITAEEFCEYHASEGFYGSTCYEEDGAYYYFGGSIAVSVNSSKLITEMEFNVLSRFL